jgi:hypothetical protein
LLAITGLIWLALHFAFSIGLAGNQAAQIFDEFTLIIAWMFIWQSADYFFVSGHNRRVEIYNSGQLALAEITFGKPHFE